MTIKAIETEYAGHLFRSRLEARWAVLFDRLGIEWEYEPQGYEVGSSRRRYLPDFHLIESEIWVEVKGRGESVNWGLIADCVDYGIGLPGDPATIAVVGQITEVPTSFPVLRHREGVEVRALVLDKSAARAVSTFSMRKLNPPSVMDAHVSATGGSGWPGSKREEGELIDGVNGLWPSYGSLSGNNAVLGQAFTDARKARFEHGQTPSRGRAVVPDYMTEVFWK